jgi:hypothetical protein
LTKIYLIVEVDTAARYLVNSGNKLVLMLIRFCNRRRLRVLMRVRADGEVPKEKRSQLGGICNLALNGCRNCIIAQLEFELNRMLRDTQQSFLFNLDERKLTNGSSRLLFPLWK